MTGNVFRHLGVLIRLVGLGMTAAALAAIICIPFGLLWAFYHVSFH